MNPDTKRNQTEITELVRYHAKQLSYDLAQSAEDSNLSIKNTAAYVHKLPIVGGYTSCPVTLEQSEQNKRFRKELFRTQTLDDALRNGVFPTCSTYELLFRGLMIAQGWLANYAEAFEDKFIFYETFNNYVFNHALTRLQLGGKSLLVNSQVTPPTIHCSEDEFFPKYMIVREGLDAWDAGLASYKDLQDYRDSHIGEILFAYEQRLKKHPDENERNRRLEKIAALRKRMNLD